MKKGFQSKRLMALLMAAVMSVNSLPVTAFAAETNLIEQSQTESVMESETAEETFAEEKEAESITEESFIEETAEEESALEESDQEEEISLLEEDTKVDDGLIDSGTFGENVTWTLDNEGVLTISGTGAMQGRLRSSKSEYIVSVVIESGVTSISSCAFEGLKKLESVEVSDSVKSIGESAFQNCSSLVDINIPNGVTKIDNYVFKNCTSLVSIEMPDSVKSIGESAFFCCESLTSVKISENVTYIKDYAFYGCDSLKSVYIPGSITKIKEFVFSNCSSLEDVEIADGVPCIGDYMFYECESLANVKIPDSVTSIGGCAFTHCSSLTKINIPNSVKRIGSGAFSQSSLITIKIPSNVTEIEGQLFEGCTNLENVEIPNGVTYIYWRSFAGCTSLKIINIPASVKSIGEAVFRGCSNLREINVDEKNQSYCSKEGVLFDYGMTELIYCPSANRENYTIPYGVCNILGYAFTDCGALNHVELPKGFMRIYERAFDGCSNLKELNIPSSIETIGKYAFNGCSSLKNIVFEGFSPEFQENSFEGVTATVYYPSNYLFWTEEIKQNYGGTLEWKAYTADEIVDSGSCGENLTWILYNNGFLNIKGNGKMQDYYYGSIENVSPWALEYGHIVAASIENGVPNIGDWAFTALCNLPNIEIPDSVITIGEGAFIECSSLNEINIPNSVKEIGSIAFGNCVSLTDIVFWGSAPIIGEGCFANVTATVYYPANDPSWTEEVRQNYGGTLTWVAKEVEPEEKELTILKQPESVTGKIGDTAIFTVEADGDDIAYQWQYCNSGSNTWKNSSMTGADTNSIEVKITKGRIGQKYRCILKDSRENQLITEEAQINQLAEKKLVIAKQPESVTGKIGDTAVFVVEAEGEGVTYQWQYCNSGSSTWKNSSMTGSTTNSIEVKITKGRIGQKYRCILKDSKGNKLTTEEVQIIQAEEKKLAILQQPESVTGKIGETAVFTVEAEGEGVTYQWQYCNSGSSSWKNSSMTGSTTNSIEVKITKGRIGQKYRCILKDSKGNKLTTEEAEIIQAEEKKLVIIQQPESVTGKIGETAVFTVEAEGEGVTYQWQYCNNGSTSWANSKMTGSTTNSIEVKITKGRLGQKYRCILKDSKGNKLTTEEVQIIQAEK